MMKILSIGNSFSQDAQRYLHGIAAAEGVELFCQNLYIGGCSLETHARNLREGGVYELERNGASTGTLITMQDALQSDDWDVVTLQQASHFSWNFDTYVPYIEEVAAAVRTLAPTAKLYIHETWAYEQDSVRLTQELGYADQHDMLRDVVASYQKAADLIHADGIIPGGRAMMSAAERGIKVHRDTFHASLGAGRYLLGLTWYSTLTGQLVGHAPASLDGPVDTSVLQAVRAAVKSVIEEETDNGSLS